MIVLDATVLVYATGSDHPLRAPCRRVVTAIGEGRLAATTTAEVIAELVAVRSRRRPRADAVELGKRYADLLSPLAAVDAEVAAVGLELYEGHARLSPLDALLAALVVHHRWRALVSAHRSFATVKGLRTVDPGTSALDELLGQPG